MLLTDGVHIVLYCVEHVPDQQVCLVVHVFAFSYTCITCVFLLCKFVWFCIGYACVCFVLHVSALFYDFQAVFVLASMPFRYIYIYVYIYSCWAGSGPASMTFRYMYIYMCVLYMHMFIYLYVFLYGRFRTSKYAFEIVNVRQSDQAVYSCVADNKYGKIIFNTTLDVVRGWPILFHFYGMQLSVLFIHY